MSMLLVLNRFIKKRLVVNALESTQVTALVLVPVLEHVALALVLVLCCYIFHCTQTESHSPFIDSYHHSAAYHILPCPCTWAPLQNH